MQKPKQRLKRPCKRCGEYFTPKAAKPNYCAECFLIIRRESVKKRDTTIYKVERTIERRISKEGICKHCNKTFNKILDNDRICLKCFSKGLRVAWRSRLEDG